MQEVDALYLTPAFLAITDLYNAQTTSLINTVISFVQVFTGGFMAAFVLMMGAAFLPAVRATNTDIQTKRAMLTYLPPEIVAASAEIKELVRAILASDAAASDGSGGGFARGGAAASAVSSAAKMRPSDMEASTAAADSKDAGSAMP